MVSGFRDWDNNQLLADRHSEKSNNQRELPINRFNMINMQISSAQVRLLWWQEVQSPLDLQRRQRRLTESP
jgi:hypothetical protein